MCQQICLAPSYQLCLLATSCKQVEMVHRIRMIPRRETLPGRKAALMTDLERLRTALNHIFKLEAAVTHRTMSCRKHEKSLAEACKQYKEELVPVLRAQRAVDVQQKQVTAQLLPDPLVQESLQGPFSSFIHRLSCGIQ